MENMTFVWPSLTSQCKFKYTNKCKNIKAWAQTNSCGPPFKIAH